VRPDAIRLAHLRATERWIAGVRVAAVVFALLQVFVFTKHFPPGYETAAAVTTGVFAAGAIALVWLSRLDRHVVLVGLVALVFDFVVVATYATLFSYEYGSPTRWALIAIVIEAALRYGLWGGAGVGVLLIPFFAFVELWRAHRFGPPPFVASRVSFPSGVHLIAGVIVGWLVGRLDREATLAEARAAEAEQLRDELGRRVDTLEAVNRCARALGSSLELESAFSAFIRELRGVVPFDRVAILLAEGTVNRMIAVAGHGEEDVFPAGSTRALSDTMTERVIQEGRTVVRRDMRVDAIDNEPDLLALGLRSRVAVPLLVGARPIGMLTVSRTQADAFSPEEVELVTLLGRLVGSAVENLRAYEAERQTTDELRRLSALRADFVSLVSHELRSPMAAVIGSARTLQQRWRQLAPDQRDAFLALIADETDRLTRLIGDVLDTSRIEAGTFSFSFSDVDLGDLVAEAAAAVELAQDEVPLQVVVSEALPRVRGDRERLRQVVTNLVDNAVKYSPAGQPVEIVAGAENGCARLTVRDHGPGIPREQHALIFEKFGRSQIAGATAKPGTGLGLFIARSIAEAHGGTLEVDSDTGAGATFTLTLPLG
jgi:signal transduction histidine kinase